jgi:hypothetical protein
MYPGLLLSWRSDFCALGCALVAFDFQISIIDQNNSSHSKYKRNAFLLTIARPSAQKSLMKLKWDKEILIIYSISYVP